MDTRYIPVDVSYRLSATAGTLTENVLTTPASGGDITVTASGQGRSGSTVIHAVKNVDSLQVLSGGKAITALTLNPGKSAALTAAAVSNHLKLKTDNAAFTWTVTGDAATVGERQRGGRRPPAAPPSPSPAAGRRVTIPITVTSPGSQDRGRL